MVFFGHSKTGQKSFFGVADGYEQEYLLDCLMIMVRKSGVCDVLKGPTMY